MQLPAQGAATVQNAAPPSKRTNSQCSTLGCMLQDHMPPVLGLCCHSRVCQLVAQCPAHGQAGDPGVLQPHAVRTHRLAHLINQPAQAAAAADTAQGHHHALPSPPCQSCCFTACMPTQHSHAQLQEHTKDCCTPSVVPSCHQVPQAGLFSALNVLLNSSKLTADVLHDATQHQRVRT